MKVRVIEKEPKELRLEVEGGGHTFCNLLQEALLEDKAVDFAGYNLPHPLVSHPTIYIRTKGRTTAVKALERTLRTLEKRMVEFKEEFRKSWEKNDQ